MYKNHRKILITAAILAMHLCACGKAGEMLKQDTAKEDLQQTEGQVIEVVTEEPRQPEEIEDPEQPEQKEIKQQMTVDNLVGSWHLDESSIDTDKLYDTIPGSMEFGSSMEIKSNGQMSWYIGADGATGTYIIEENVLHAAFSSIMEETSYETDLIVHTEAEEPTLTMEYKDFTFTWIHGEGETLRGEDEL